MDKRESPTYRGALEAAGAIVHAFEEFGSYQGDWWAKITYEGQTGWVSGAYGSCSGCDAIEADFGWRYEEETDEVFNPRFAAFGKEYLDNILEQQAAEAKAAEHSNWDSEADKMIQFIKDNA